MATRIYNNNDNEFKQSGSSNWVVSKFDALFMGINATAGQLQTLKVFEFC